MNRQRRENNMAPGEQEEGESTLKNDSTIDTETTGGKSFLRAPLEGP